jgi:hypothetical protein
MRGVMLALRRLRCQHRGRGQASKQKCALQSPSAGDERDVLHHVVVVASRIPDQRRELGLADGARPQGVGERFAGAPFLIRAACLHELVHELLAAATSEMCPSTTLSRLTNFVRHALLFLNTPTKPL